MTEWQQLAKVLIRVEMARRDMTYSELARALEKIGVHQTEFNVRNKIGRGTFSAPFLLQCLTAMRVETIDLKIFVTPAAGRGTSEDTH